MYIFIVNFLMQFCVFNWRWIGTFWIETNCRNTNLLYLLECLCQVIRLKLFRIIGFGCTSRSATNITQISSKIHSFRIKLIFWPNLFPSRMLFTSIYISVKQIFQMEAFITVCDQIYHIDLICHIYIKQPCLIFVYNPMI